MYFKMSLLSLTDIFELRCLVENIDVRLNCRIENGVKQLLAVITNDGDIVLHYTYGDMPAVIRRIPWFNESNKTIQAVCFDPTATWLLVICLDVSLYIIPALSLVDKKQKIDCKWSVNDITYFPKHVQTPFSKPLCVVWWQTLDCNQNALIGHENGAIGLISLTDGRCLGFCSISESVTQMYLCQDNSLDCILLLINSSSGQQYRLVLEQPSTGYLWPPETSSTTDTDSTRSKLYSLKQMGVDKFFLLKQRIAESRSIRRDSQASDSASESSHSDQSTTSVPELLPRLCDTYFAPQYARNRHLFSAFYKPTSLLTVHASDVESAPLYVHKLPHGTDFLLLTDRLIYTISDDHRMVSVVSTQLSECPLEGDSEFNPSSLIAQFTVQKDSEKILNVYKLTDITLIKEKRSKEDGKRDKEKTFILPKTINDVCTRKVKIDTCVIVTNNSIYKLLVRSSPINKFISLINEEWNLEKAEYLSVVFSLNLQQLLESCGDILISNSSFHQGLILFKQAKVHILKRVLKLAVSADCKALLKFINLCLNTSKVDMSMATKIHIGNLAVMAYTELVLRYGGHLRINNTKEFMNFLYYEEFYDQVLAVNVACQAGHWNIVTLLAKSRGLQPEVVAALSQILQTSRMSRTHDYEFLLAISEPTLTQSLLIYPSYCQVIFNFIKLNVECFPVDILQRLVVQFDPSQPSALPLVSKLFQRTKVCSSLDSTLETLDFESTSHVSIIREFVETFIIVLISLIEKNGSNSYNTELLGSINHPNVHKEKDKIKKFPNLHPLSCGYEHAAVIRNSSVYTMGIASSGCLGLGPLLTHSSPPRLVSTLTDLRLKVLSISCGRKHTLALTDFGIYVWGSNSYGQLGLGQHVREIPYPQIIESLAGTCVVDVVTGQYHSIALTASGEVYTWGWGIHGQLGHNSCNNEFYPKLLHFNNPVMQIAAGHAHSLILTTEGKLYGFGSNAFGQLESCNIEGAKVTKPTWVVVMPDIYTPIEKIATAYFHNICVRADQEVYTWGANPQEVRFSQSKYSQKLVGLGTKLYEPWKNSVHLYTSINQKPIEQVAVGFRHSTVLHNGKLLWNKCKDGELCSPKLQEQDSLSVLNQRFFHVSCGPDYIMAMEHTGKLLAWGNNTMAQTLLGKSYEESARQDGKIIMFKNTKRVVKFPSNSQTNGEPYPVEVPGLPTMAITYSSSDQRVFTKSYIPYSVRSIENYAFHVNCDIHPRPFTKFSINFNYLHAIPKDRFGSKTLHYVLETYYGFYDSENILSKCIDINNYQAASKIAMLDGHYSDSLGFQLLAFKKHMDTFHLDLNISKEKDNNEINQSDIRKVDSNKVDLNSIKFEFNLINNSAAHILSASSSLDSIRQWGDDLEHQGGCESPCEMAELGDVRQLATQYVQSVKSDSPPISSVSKLIEENTIKEESKFIKENCFDPNFKDTNASEILKMASHLIEFYIKKTYTSENHILMQNILLKCIEFWLTNNLPVSILEKVLLKNMDKYFYPLSILLFCKNFNNNLGEEIIKKDEDINKQKSAGFLKEFSTKFCLQLCSMVLENVNKA